jgi:large subunit ribosomal protein L9
MKVILAKDTKGVGRKGEVKEVSEGYARNFLIPKHLAIPATTAILQKIQKEEAEHQQKIQRQEALSLQLQKKLQHQIFKVSGKADGQKLFASIHQPEIARAISQQGNLSIDPKQVIIKQAIKTLGIHDAEIKLTDNVHAKVKIQVESKT